MILLISPIVIIQLKIIIYLSILYKTPHKITILMVISTAEILAESKTTKMTVEYAVQTRWPKRGQIKILMIPSTKIMTPSIIVQI